MPQRNKHYYPCKNRAKVFDIFRSNCYFPKMTGKEIKALRDSLGLTRDEFAAKLGVANRRTVHRWEIGESSPRGLHLRELERLGNNKTQPEGWL